MTLLSLYGTIVWCRNLDLDKVRRTEAFVAESAADDILYLVMYIVCVNRHQLMRLFFWQSTRVQVTNQTIDQAGDVREAVRDKLGSVSWKSMSGSLLIPLGAWPAIVMSGGRYDPSPVKRSSE